MGGVHLVIAKYQEDTSWVRDVAASAASVCVYDKSQNGVGTLPNVGREAHTFLHHIVSHYACLDPRDCTMFLQGHPFDHDVYPDSIQTHLEPPRPTRCTPVSGAVLWCDGCGKPTHLGDALPVDATYRELFAGEPPGLYVFSPGAQYVVPHAAILARPLCFWQRMLDMSCTRADFPWVAERLWMLALDPDVQVLSP